MKQVYRPDTALLAELASTHAASHSCWGTSWIPTFNVATVDIGVPEEILLSRRKIPTRFWGAHRYRRHPMKQHTAYAPGESGTLRMTARR